MSSIPQFLVPNLASRNSILFAAGRARFALTSKVTGRTLYLQIRAWNSFKHETAPLEDATHLYISEGGYGTPQVASLRLHPATYQLNWNDGASVPHKFAVCALLKHVVEGFNHPGLTIKAEDKCGLCGRRLIDPVSVDRGLGPECAGKPTGTKLLRCFKPVLEPVA